MQANLYEEDLKEEHRNIPTSSVGFDHLNPEAQEAVRIFGKATFYRLKGTNQENCNVVYPPKEQ